MVIENGSDYQLICESSGILCEKFLVGGEGGGVVL